jgi:hypothetical protein
VQRGSDKHGPAQDDRLKAELDGMLGSAGGHREEWADPEPAADDDAPRPDLSADPGRSAEEADEQLNRMRHDMDVANDSRYNEREIPDPPDV